MLLPGSFLTMPFTEDKGALSTSEPLHLLFLSLRYSSPSLQLAGSLSTFSSRLTRHFLPEDNPDHPL